MKTLNRCLLAGMVAGFGATANAAPETYEVDLAHSTVQFVIGHLGFSKTVGRFNRFEGSYLIDAENPSSNSVQLVIDAASIDSNHEKRDDHLRSPDFLDVRQYPELKFESNGYEGTADAGTLSGDLTMHGQTHPVSFEVTKIGEGDDPWGGYRNGFVANATIMRSRWGINYSIPNVPDEMEINVFVEGIRQ